MQGRLLGLLSWHRLHRLIEGFAGSTVAQGCGQHFTKLNSIGVLLISALVLPASAQSWLVSMAPEPLKITVRDAKLGREILLDTQLLAPAASHPWQTVVLPSNCSGRDDQFWSLMAPALVQRGFAVVLLDSFTPRGFPSVCMDQRQMWQEARVADVIAVLKALRRDARIDSARIALGGHSTGAVTSFMASFVQAADVAKTEAIGYTAYFAVGAACDLTFKNPTLWGPLLLISGEMDDYTFAEPCQAEARRLQGAGAQVTMQMIKGANHNMSTSGWVYNPSVQRMPKDIPRMYMQRRDEKGVLHLELDDGRSVTAADMMKAYGGFLLSKTRGGTIGGNWDQFPQVDSAILQHLERAGFRAR